MLPADLVAKLDQCAASDLAGPRDFWFNWLARFTTMVAAGLVLELPELVYELKLITREWIPYFRYRIYTPRERSLQTAKVVAFMGWILIVAGVVGERYAEVRVKDFDARIQECSDAKVREATINAGTAQASAKGAADDAGRAKQEADEAAGTASTAKSLAKEAKAGTADATRKTNELRAQAKSLQADIAEEKESFRRLRTWRSLTNKDSMITSLESFAVTEYQFSGVYGDEESEYLLAEINNLLTKAGWTRVKSAPGDTESAVTLNLNKVEEHVPVTTLVGIRVFIQYPTSFEELKVLPDAARLQHAKAAGVFLKLLSANLFPPDEDEQRKSIFFEKTGQSRIVKIVVGRKP